jgi:prepilin-type N-terminal cleavage/methylation domain-containing protein
MALKSLPLTADPQRECPSSTHVDRVACVLLFVEGLADMRTHAAMRGFTLVEMVVTILIFGLLLAFSVPAFQTMNQTQQLHGAAENIAAQLRLARERAMATGTTQTMHFTMNFPSGTTWDYHIHNTSPGPGWSLPNGITYASVTVNPTFQTDGSSNASGLVVLTNRTSERDTVSVLMSGMVTCQ